MTKEQLPERLRSIAGLELVDPNDKSKRVITISEARMEALEREYAYKLMDTPQQQPKKGA